MGEQDRTGMPRGYQFGGLRAQAVQRELGRLAIENRNRVPCPVCGLACLDLARHVALCHEDGE
jgi:hypothetical protein